MNSREQEIIDRISGYVESKFRVEHTGHDWWHIYRVWQLAKKIAEQEKANNFIVELGALLHDVADHKLGNEAEGMREIKELLDTNQVKEEDRQHVLNIVENTSYKGANVRDKADTLEAKIVQDSDRLDAIGAVGIARTFAYGGNKKREIYNPNIIPPVMHTSFDDYKKSTAPTINHFYEKLLLLKNRMHTETAKLIAEERHQFMEYFLEQFFKEWDNR